MQNFLLALTFTLGSTAQLTKTYGLPKPETVQTACAIAWQVPCSRTAPNGKPYYGPAF